MNRLILVGNGFDLAHGLPTSYADFIRSYLVDAIKKYKQDKSFVDELLSIENVYNGMSRTLGEITTFNVLKIFQGLQSDQYFNIKIRSSILRISLEHLNSFNWVDLENLYFKLLLLCKNGNNFDEQKVINLNRQFQHLRKNLKII